MEGNKVPGRERRILGGFGLDWKTDLSGVVEENAVAIKARG